MTTLHDLVRAADWMQVEAALLRLCSDEAAFIAPLEDVLRHLCTLEPRATRMRIAIEETFRPPIDDEPFTDVFGRDGSLNRDQPDFGYLRESMDSAYALEETRFALEFHPWDEWLGMTIEPSTLDGHGHPEIVAHCLLEMTSMGLNEEGIQAQCKEIERRADAVAAMSEEERERTLIPGDQVMARIRQKIAERR